MRESVNKTQSSLNAETIGPKSIGIPRATSIPHPNRIEYMPISSTYVDVFSNRVARTSISLLNLRFVYPGSN